MLYSPILIMMEKLILLVAGEWMPVTFFKNTGKGFVKLNNTGIENNIGWWNSIVAGDFDNDGDIDYIVGNLGSEYKLYVINIQPLTILAKDIDGNGSLDAMVFCYMKAEDGTMKPFPCHKGRYGEPGYFNKKKISNL